MTAALILAQATTQHADALVEAYAKGLRSPLITGFFTLTSASIAIGAFMWARMKDVVYDKAEYQARVRAMRSFNPKLSAVGPSFRFLYHILATGVMLFIAAVVQATLGFRETKASVVICLVTAAIAVLSFLLTLALAVRNAVAWHAYSEQTASANANPKSTATTT